MTSRLVLRVVGRNDRRERVEHLLLGIAAVDHLFRGAGLAADIVALHVSLLAVPISAFSRIR